MTCAKQIVRCTIRTKGGDLVVGENRCLNPQPVCPRAPGEGYEKCQTICEQVGHAEEDAVVMAAMAGVDIRGATAELEGHTYACMNCQHTLSRAGVRGIFWRTRPAG